MTESMHDVGGSNIISVTSHLLSFIREINPIYYIFRKEFISKRRVKNGWNDDFELVERRFDFVFRFSSSNIIIFICLRSFFESIKYAN